MRESAKAVLILCLIVSAVAAAIAWGDDRPNTLTWKFRIGGIVAALASLGLLLVLHSKRDRVPDFLHQMGGGYLNRGGLGFNPGAAEVDGVLYFYAHFQNQYSNPCQAQIALRPSMGFLSRAEFPSIVLDIDCPAAGFGVVRVPIPLDPRYGGKHQKFDIGATVNYPEGRGRRLRFRDGGAVRTNANFRNSFGSLLTAAGALGGMVVLTRPPAINIKFPTGLAADLPPNAQPTTKILWQLGDEVPA